MRRLVLLTAILILLAGGAYAAYRYSQSRPDAVERAATTLGLAQATAGSGPLQATGLLEAHTVRVSSDLGGRITALAVAEGELVDAGQHLLEVDDSLLQARIAQADAAVAEAEAELALLEAGARAEAIRYAQAQLDQAQRSAEAAKQALDDAEQLRDRPDDLDLKLIEAETTLAIAERQASAAKLQAEATDLQRDLWGRVTKLLEEGFDVALPFGGNFHVDKPAERAQANTQWNISSQEAWEAWQAAYAAEDAVDSARITLADYRRQRATPIGLDSQVNQAQAAYQQALAGVDQARAVVQGLEEGATVEELELARQAVEQARASRTALDMQQAKTRVEAPVGGLVTQSLAHLGEVALPAVPLLEIADLSEVTLTVYVPVPEQGRIRLGQAVQVRVDSFPGRIFDGQVSRIADQAEYTPKTVQTREDRVTNVFGVEIRIPNPDGALKPGMPADATFVESGQP